MYHCDSLHMVPKIKPVVLELLWQQTLLTRPSSHHTWEDVFWDSRPFERPPQMVDNVFTMCQIIVDLVLSGGSRLGVVGRRKFWSFRSSPSSLSCFDLLFFLSGAGWYLTWFSIMSDTSLILPVHGWASVSIGFSCSCTWAATLCEWDWTAAPAHFHLPVFPTLDWQVQLWFLYNVALSSD